MTKTKKPDQQTKTLRDEFAIAAPPALIQRSTEIGREELASDGYGQRSDDGSFESATPPLDMLDLGQAENLEGEEAGEIAIAAYAIADAMLAVRKMKPTQPSAQ